MRMSRSKLFAVRVANFAAEFNMSGRDVVELVMVAERAFSAGGRGTRDGSARARSAERNAADRFELKAMDHGFSVSWSGLWPTLKLAISGREINLPCDSR